MNQLTFSRFKIIFLLLSFLILGGWLIFQSQSITTWDQGDYGRVLSSILSGPADGKEYRHWEKPTMEWAFKDPIDSIWQVNNFAEVYFNLHANFQKMFRSTFSLPLLSLISKLVSLFLLTLLARSISRTIGWKFSGACIVWAMLTGAFFMAHNIYLLSSFYQEHIFWLGLPLLLSGIVGDSSRRNTIFMIAGAAICGLSKHQFFYIPTLVLIWCGIWSYFQRLSMSRLLVLGLVIVQAQCLITLANNNPLKSQYYYHAAYYGSYVLASPKLLTRLNVPSATLRCIGSDRWGVILAGKNGDDEGGVIQDYYDQVQLTANDILLPYLLEPSLLWHMWRFSKAALWTAHPFHNIRTLPYVITPEGLNQPFPVNQKLLILSDLREHYLTQRVEIVSILSLFISCFMIYRRTLGKLPFLILFLLCLLWSQIAIALIGEGFRDLGKHFAAAQLSYDFLLVVLFIAIVAYCRQKVLSRFKNKYGTT